MEQIRLGRRVFVRDAPYRNYVIKELYREAAYKLAEVLEAGESFAAHPHPIQEHKTPPPYELRGEIEMELTIDVLPIKKMTMGAKIFSKITELLEKDSIIEVPYGPYYWEHLHTESVSALMAAINPYKMCKIKCNIVDLEPIYDSEGNEIGRAGKCEGCGKVFYSRRSE